MGTRAHEYSTLIFEILEDDAQLRAQGLPGLSVDEINQLRLMVLAAILLKEKEIERRRISS